MAPGSPSTPDLPTQKRIAFGLTAVLLGLTSSLGTALFAVNLGTIQGELGFDQTDGNWLTTVYSLTNVSMNLLIIKYRQQYGLRIFCQISMIAYALAAVAHLYVESFSGALTVRALSGVAGASLGSMAIYYMLQVFPAKFRVAGLVFGLGIGQFGIPLARIMSPYLLDQGSFTDLYSLEAGLGVLSVCAIYLLPLPPGIRVQAFDRWDALTYPMFAVALGLIVAVLGLGRIEWWSQAPWQGWALVAAIGLLASALVIEHHRQHPLIDTRWLLTPAFARFILATFLVRALLSEQTYGAPGLLQAIGMGSEQLTTLFTVILVASFLGVLVGAAALITSMKLLEVLVPIALACISIGAFVDAHATVETHPINLYISQALFGFATTLFLIGALMAGIGHLVKRGFGSITTFGVAFATTQIVGGLAGSAALGSFQIFRLAHHTSYLADGLASYNTTVTATLGVLSSSYSQLTVDKAIHSANGASSLGQQLSMHANVLAFNDVFMLVGIIAVGQLILCTPFAIKRLRSSDTVSPADTNAGGAI